MRYIETSTLNCQIYPGQRRQLERLKHRLNRTMILKYQFLNWSAGHWMLDYQLLLRIQVLWLNWLD